MLNNFATHSLGDRTTFCISVKQTSLHRCMLQEGGTTHKTAFGLSMDNFRYTLSRAKQSVRMTFFELCYTLEQTSYTPMYVELHIKKPWFVDG